MYVFGNMYIPFTGCNEGLKFSKLWKNNFSGGVMPWDGIMLLGSKIVELLCDIFLLGWAFLNNCFGICPKLFIKPIVAFFFKGSSILKKLINSISK